MINHIFNKILCIIKILILFIIFTIFSSFLTTFAKNEKVEKIYKEHIVLNGINIKIDYIIPDFIYNNLDDLHDSFFTELYNYIINENPKKNAVYLAALNINSVNDALNITRLWDNTKVGLTIVGYAFAQFYIDREVGGSFDSQKNKKSFVGYCIKNDKFVDFLYFMKEYFYHFRLDEGYTGPKSEGKDPNGSDYFASPMASIVDTAKFFSYNKKSLPSYFYITNNVPKLYETIPGVLNKEIKNDLYKVIKSDEYILPDDLTCFGFEFDGWYLNDKKIKKITTKDFSSNVNSIKLYAKFKRTRNYRDNILKSTPSDIY